jgi:predicted ArsR family transcriptional regulator
LSRLIGVRIERVPNPREIDDAVRRLAALDEPIRRRLFDHVRRSPTPVGREEAAEAVGIGRSLAAYHLDKLAEEGLLLSTYRRPEGRTGPGAGRPAKLYGAPESELSVSVPARDYEFVAHMLAEAAEADASGGTRAGLAAVAARTGRQLGEGLRGEALVDALAARGYEPVEDEAGVITLGNCPFHRLAADHRDLVCGMNQAYLGGVLEGLQREDVTADLDPEPGRCCVVIRPSRGAGSS